MQELPRDTRRALITAASELLAQGGPAHVTLRSVGAATNVSRTTPYRHFRDKDDLLSTVAAENLTYMSAEMRRAATDAAGGSTALFRTCITYVQVAWEFPNHYRLAFGADHEFKPSRQLEEAATDFNRYFSELVAAAQQDNVLIAGDARDVGPLLWVLLHGLAMSSHLVTADPSDSGTGYGVDALPRILALALETLAPR